MLNQDEINCGSRSIRILLNSAARKHSEKVSDNVAVFVFLQTAPNVQPPPSDIPVHRFLQSFKTCQICLISETKEMSSDGESTSLWLIYEKRNPGFAGIPVKY